MIKGDYEFGSFCPRTPDCRESTQLLKKHAAASATAGHHSNVKWRKEKPPKSNILKRLAAEAAVKQKACKKKVDRAQRT